MTASSDPFSKYRINQEKIIKSPNIEQSESDNVFSKYRLNEEESIPKSAFRNLSRGALRTIEQVLGFPGDIQSLIQSGVLSGLEKIVGVPASEESREKLKSERAPTSKELKDISKDISGGFTEPKNALEQKIDDYAELVGQLLGPMKFRKALGIGLIGSGAKEGLNTLGLGEGSQEVGKLGSVFLASLYNPGGALKYASKQFERANTLSRGASISAVPFEGHVTNLVSDLKKGVSTPSKSSVIRPAEELLDKIRPGGKILVQDLTASKRDINTLMKDPSVLKREKKLLLHLGKEVDKAIKPFERINPAFSKAYRPANEIYGAVMQGTKVADYLKKTLGAKSILATVAGEALLGHPEAILPTLGIGGAAYGTAKGIDFLTRVHKSPELRKYYLKALIAASKEDAGALREYEDKIHELLGNQKE